MRAFVRIGTEEPTFTPLQNATPAEAPAAPEMDEPLSRRDAWMFGPLIAVVVALPLAAAVVFGISAWRLAERAEISAPAASATFASRWPNEALPVLRQGG
jgi:hypothetical protein